MEKELRRLSIVASVAALICACADTDSLREVFNDPPASARPRVWWHWEDGNVTREGLLKDLEWMDRIGIAGFHHFDAALAGSPVVDNRLIYMDEGWKDAFRFAISVADSLGMEVGIASSPGWSCTGGPWVREDDAMKKLVWSSLDLNPGERAGALPQPASNLGYYRDIAVLAFPLYDTDSSVRSVKVSGRPSRSQWADSPVSYGMSLEALTADGSFEEVAKIPDTSAESITVNIPATRSSRFRLMKNGVQSTCGLELYNKSRIEHAEEKAGFSTPFDLYAYKTEVTDGERFADISECADLTGLLSESGSLDWAAPGLGKWRVIRMGYTLTGKKNYPAPPEATGLEVDKLDSMAWKGYFDNYLSLYEDCLGDLFGGRGVRYLLMDSYEAKWQTWTCSMEDLFMKKRGYSLRPWLPVLTGEILVGPEESERFLFDWRQTIADLYAENYSRLAGILEDHGMAGSYIESQENGRVFVADGMDIKKNATVPMSACWVPVPVETQHSTITMAMADMKESSSVSHLYGKKHTAAESFTADGQEIPAYSFSPAKLKYVADTELSCGVNQFYIHESSHQPLDTLRPGLGLLIYGQWFNRHETWAEQAVAWIDYLARSSAMLMQGRDVSDVLVYYGEDTNITARYGLEPFRIKDGYNFDYINPSGLSDLEVRGGRLCAPSGSEYSVLCLDNAGLPESEEVCAQIERLRGEGARICLAEELDDVLSEIAPDLESDHKLRFLHRQLRHHDVYWINKPDTTSCKVNLSFRSRYRYAEVWDPVSGEMKGVPASRTGRRTALSLDMKPEDAVFVVLSGKKTKIQRPVAVSEVQDISENWTVSFSDNCVLEMKQLESYTESSNPEVKYFSGTAEYSRSFIIDKVCNRTILDLGEVRDIAQVIVNGHDCGILWKTPFSTDISDSVKEGENSVTVRITNPWANRLIGDELLPPAQRTTYTSSRFFTPESELLPSGMLGPVTVSGYEPVR